MTSRVQAQRTAERERASEVARQATDIQRQTGCTRTEALRIAEARIPFPSFI